MKDLSKQQKQVLYVIAAGVAVYLLYRWYQGRNTAASTAMAPTDPTASTQYAALAGQEQSDMANLQQQLMQERKIDQGLARYIAGLAAGQTKIKRHQTVTVKKGSAFARYYRRVTGHAPPATVRANNFIYEAWRDRVPWKRLEQLLDPSKGDKADHDPRHHQHVDHPNHNHHPSGGAGTGPGGKQHKPKDLNKHQQATPHPGRGRHDSGITQHHASHHNKGTHRSGARR